MQGKGLSLRLSLLALVVVLIFGSLGGLTLARDAFDNDYKDCPASTRLDAVSGLTIDRTDEDDEIRISWDALDTTTLSGLGPNGFRARLTIIVDGEDARNVALGDTSLVVDDINFAEDLTVSMAVTLGDYVISDIREADFTSGLPGPRFSSDIRVSANEIRGTFAASTGVLFSSEDPLVQVADRAEIGADIEEIEFLLSVLSGNADIETLRGAYTTAKGVTPRVGDTFNPVITSLVDALDDTTPEADEADRFVARRRGFERVIDADDVPQKVGSSSDLKDLGTFYYLGFNDLFDNWFVAKKGATTVDQRPSDARFRVGLRHGNDGLVAGDADFENYRIVIEDSSGDLLGYQAETVEAARTYGGNKIVFSGNAEVDVAIPFLNETQVGAATKNFSNVRLSNRVTADGAAVDPYYERSWTGGEADFVAPESLRDNLSHGNVGLVNSDINQFPIAGVVYADAPIEYFDFPSNVFESDGRYTIKAWAEDSDGTRISPQTSIVLSTREQQSAEGTEAGYTGYGTTGVTSGLRIFLQLPAGSSNRFTVYGFSIQDE